MNEEDVALSTKLLEKTLQRLQKNAFLDVLVVR